MEVQTECNEPPLCDPQPSGKINKAAFKLFGKRKSGSGFSSFFSMRNKGDGGSKPAGKVLELVRSKTHEGLIIDTPSELEGRKKEESASSDQLHHATNGDSESTAPARSSITKSFSFFSLLRRSSTRASDGAATVGRRGRGLKGLFSSMRWRRKERPALEDSGEVQEVAKEVKEGDLILSSCSNSVEILNQDVTLTLEPQTQVFEENSAPESVESWNGHSPQPEQGIDEECGKSPPQLEHLLAKESPPPSPLRAQTQGSLVAKLSSPAHGFSSSAPVSAATPPLERSVADPPSEPSMDRLCSMFTDVTSLKSFDSLTGCGDIIADPEEDSGNGGSGTSSGTCSSSGGGGGGRRVSGAGGVAERCSPAKPPISTQASALTSIPASSYIPVHQRPRAPVKKPQGSGVVAYMGGGEEMASPEGVDDADMQGLWHMLPQKGEDSPALPRAEPVLHHAPQRSEKRPPPVKGLGLSKIPVSGGSRACKQQPTRPSPPPTEKELQDAPPSDEGYWDSSTPGPEEEESGFLLRDSSLLPRDSCSGDALYDLYDHESPGAVGSDDDDMSSPTLSTGDLKLSPPSQNPSSSSSSSFRSMKGSTSLPRDSKIPISVRQVPPPHSSSQGSLSSSASNNPPPKTDAPTRTRIPVSKVPVRRSGNKNTGAARNLK